VNALWQPPAFSTEAWYSDPADHRCPHDAGLEFVEVRELARDEVRQTAITLKLLGADQDGWITLSYFGVRRHSLTSYFCDQGAGEWLRDEFSESKAGLTEHRITLCSGASGTSQWTIEAKEVRYGWTPKPA
jgi:hypothetical protein